MAGEGLLMRTVLLAMVCLLGCGGGGGDAVSKFTGTWEVIGTRTGTCSDGSTATPVSSTGQVLVTEGTTSDLVRAGKTAMACPIPLNVSGNRATLGGTATCTDDDGNTLQFLTWTLTVDGDSGSETGTATVAIPAAGGSCNLSFSATLTR